MDKVIIDGIDVSECNMKCNNGDCALYYAELNNDNNELIYGFNCSDNQDCYYKQFKRLQHYQAEFEHELMNDYTYDGYISPNGFTPIDVIKHIKSELKRLEQENERLKAENEKLNKMTGIFSARLCEKYKQTLQEIREIVSEPCIVDENCQTCNSGCMQKDILAKINEVIGVE